MAPVRGQLVEPATETLAGKASVKFTQSRETAEKNVDRETMEAAVLQVATEKNEQAVLLRDEGKIDEAKEILENNAEYLKANAAALGSEVLEDYGAMNAEDASTLESEEEWKASRKKMRDQQFENRSQQSY